MVSEFAAEMIARGGATGFALLFFALLIGHAFGDYPLQGHFLAAGKNRHLDSSTLFGGAAGPKFLWVHALTAHCLVHAGIVWLITGSPVLALAELVLHWAIDFARCESWTSFTMDQSLHMTCKLIYVSLLIFGWL